MMGRIRSILKRNKVLFRIKKSYDHKKMKFYFNVLGPEKHAEILYRKHFGNYLDLKNPTTFNEKLNWLKLFWNPSVKSICADKYEVRQYIIEQGESDCLNQLYGVYEAVDEISWEKLPHSFVLKVNNTCGANIICADKDELNEIDVKKKLKGWLKDKFWKNSSELHYQFIEPKIICEKYLETDAGFLPIDYKIYCFNGKPKVAMICVERESGKPKFYLTDFTGKILPFNKRGIETIREGITSIELPKVIKEMYDLSTKLSKHFPFVRMDFYDYNGRAIFGEMTFTPRGCLDNNISAEGEKIMGEWIDLTKINLTEIST